MIYFEVRETKNQEILISNMDKFSRRSIFLENKHQTLRSEKTKSSYFEGSDLSVWLVVENEPDLISSNKYFNYLLQSHVNATSLYWDYFLKKIVAISHTLVTVQGQMKQKIEGLLNQESFRGENYEEVKSKLQELVRKNPDKVAELLIFLNKKVFDIEATLDGFEVAHLGKQPKEFSPQEVNIKKVLLNILNSFHSELNEREIYIKLQIDDAYAEANKIILDYKTFDLAMHNFLHNITKYAKYGYPVGVYFEKGESDYRIIFEMMSCRIEREEVDSIFDEGVTGQHATYPGAGIGMFVAKKALHLNKMEISVKPDYSKSSNDGEGVYTNNSFFISGCT